MSEICLLIEDLYHVMSFQRVPPRRLKLPPSHTVDDEEKAFLTEVAVSSRLELLDDQRRDEEGERETQENRRR